ncbi:solute carrier family 35 member F6 [Patella vulgata]|uniref:solute carrier family 35 member F6 n=1 Tax=Patella vulgata TaxID=6465 RepID=UPI0021805544|nr:solute carrier family 35 member F6 [Patella vulgata]
MEPEGHQSVIKYLITGFILIISEIITSLARTWGKIIRVPGSSGAFAPNDDGSTYTGHSDGHFDEFGAGDGKKPHEFYHTFFMAPMLYLPQLFCLLLFYIMSGTGCGRRYLHPEQERNAVEGAQNPRGGARRPLNRRVEQDMRYSKGIFVIPAIFNYAATCLLYVGFNLTYPSSTILFKGAILFFTSLLSVAFLGRNMNPRMWIGVVIGIMGLANLGIHDYIYMSRNDYDTNGIVAGDLLIVMAQIMYSIQAVIEQKLLTRYTNLTPLETLGFEGLYGFCISFFLLIIFSFVNAGAFSNLPDHYLEAPIDALKQMRNSWQASIIVIGMMIFNTIHYLMALMITKDYGATPRMVINSIAYAVTWGIILALKWQTYKWYLIPGFPLVVLGFLVYFDVFMCIYRFIRRYLCRAEVEDDQVNLLGNGHAGGAIQ